MLKPGPALNEADAYNSPALDVFVPNAGARHETAVALVKAAQDAGLPSDHIRAHPNGYYISEALADVVYAEPDEEPEPEPEPVTPPQTPDEAPAATGRKASGNRAAKK